MSRGGQCPICLNDYNGLHEHHVIPRELTLNGVKGVNGPTIWICATCHDFIHREAKARIAKAGSRREYFSPDQAQRAAPYLKILEAALRLNADEKSAGQQNKVVVSFDQIEMERLHAAKLDHGFTNLGHFVRALVLRAIGLPPQRKE